MRLALFLSFLFMSATNLLAQSRYAIEGDTLTLDMTVAAPGYEFNGKLDEYDGTEVFFRERYILKGEGPNQISWAGALGECFYMYPTSDEQSLEQNTDLYQF